MNKGFTMQNGKYYCCLNDFLAQNRHSNSKMFILVGEYTNFDISYLEFFKGEICGAIVPFIVYNNEFFNKGIIACTIAGNSDFFLVENLATFDIEPKLLENKESLVVMLDGLSPNITQFLDDLFETVPENTQIIGGGAGKMSFENDPVIFTKQKMYSNAAVIITTDLKLHIGIENGWEFLEGPFLATSSDKNILKTLNFKNSFEVYKEIVEKDSGLSFEDDGFFNIAKSYPLGIVKFNNETIVRDPIYINDDGHLVLVGDVLQNSSINILKGTKENLIKSSGKAAKSAVCDLRKDENDNVFVFDCISRSIFLGDSFEEELKEIKKYMNPKANLYGALTLGEIANNGNEYISFYNKSCVVGVLC
jgi:hypothetical protein